VTRTLRVLSARNLIFHEQGKYKAATKLRLKFVQDGAIAPQYAPDACDVVKGGPALAVQQDRVGRSIGITQAVAECLSIQTRSALY
jgi:hypothetical protein